MKAEQREQSSVLYKEFVETDYIWQVCASMVYGLLIVINFEM